MSISYRTLVVGAVLGLFLYQSGCGDPPPEFGQVTGIVVIRGKPQPGLLVRFFPDPGQGNLVPGSAMGTTDTLGKYQLHYIYKDMEGDGAAVGWHKVMLEDPALSQLPQGQAAPPPRFSEKYNSPATTPLSFEVKPGAQTIDIPVD